MGVSTVAPLEVATASASIGTSSTLVRSAADPAQSGIAKTSLAGFKPGNIISDAVFTDEKTMSEAQIQSFFNSKVSKCVVGKDENGKPFVCLKDFRINSVNMPADGYCSGYKGAANETAARIIYKVAQACDINPQVLIVMLQKEQGLVTHVWPSAWRYDMALGQGCPDTAPCDPQFVGFFHQIYGAGRQMQIYMEGKWFTWYAPGKTWGILYHPNANCGRGNVYVANKATSALYYYTPYQPNAAALRAGYGEGDGCSSYGNRNFYNYFTDWFGSTQKPANPCDVPGTVGSANRQYVATTTLTTRKAPSTQCTTGTSSLETGTILQARRVTAGGDWLEVQTLEGLRWVSRDGVRFADDKEAVCPLPGGTSSAQRQYVVRSATAARIGPWEACSLESSVLGVGTVLQATRVSGSGNWLEVQTQSGPRWIARSAVDYATAADIGAVCVDPNGTRKAIRQYVVRTSDLAWVSPLVKCGTNARAFAAGTVVQATRISDSGKWLEVRTGVGLRWVARSSVAECVVEPTGSRTAIRQYVANESLGALISPLTECGTATTNWGPGTGPQPVRAGTVLQATRISGSGKWLQVQTSVGPRWVARSAVTQCVSDPYGARADAMRYVVQKPVEALVSPLPECGTAPKYRGPGTVPPTLDIGTVYQATRISGSGKWLEVQTEAGRRWVDKSAVTQCVTDPYGARKASLQYVVRNSAQTFASPIPECVAAVKKWGPGTSPSSLEAGTVVQATRVSGSGNWLEVQTQSGLQWIARGDVDLATDADISRVCPAPAGATKAVRQYVSLADINAVVSPAPECGWATKSQPVRTATVVQATRTSGDGGWLEIQTSVGPRWVARSSVTQCVVDPYGARTAVKQYLVTNATRALISPIPECATNVKHWGPGTAPSTLPAGTVYQATRISGSGKWLELQTEAGPKWVSRSDVREQ